jgi:hypothetical protein
MMAETKTGIERMREPFADNQISKLPKPTKQQTDAVKADYKQGFRCPDCGGWHHPKVDHLDYVGHAALTDRLLECDINWTWRPLATTDLGLPAFDSAGGLWIELTVCGTTRLGYGNAAPKAAYGPGDREKEVIGDALRNAAMRFGAALDLWHKGDLHVADDNDAPDDKPATVDSGQISDLQGMIEGFGLNLGWVLEKFEAKFGVKTLADLPVDKFATATAQINRWNDNAIAKREADKAKESEKV